MDVKSNAKWRKTFLSLQQQRRPEECFTSEPGTNTATGIDSLVSNLDGGKLLDFFLELGERSGV